MSQLFPERWDPAVVNRKLHEDVNRLERELKRDSALYEDLIKDLKTDFFEAATAEVEKENLASQVIKVPDWAIADIDEYVSVWYPGWKVVAYDSGSIDGGVIDVEIEENPEWKKFREGWKSRGREINFKWRPRVNELEKALKLIRKFADDKDIRAVAANALDHPRDLDYD